MGHSQITFLGTVGDILEIKHNRTGAGIILDVDGTQILIDPGIGTIVRASQANIELKKTKIILCSSSELSRTNDLDASIEFTDKDIHLVCPKGTGIRPEYQKHLKTVLVDEDKSTHIKNIDIDAYFYENSLSFKLTTPRFVLGYITKAKHSKALIEKFNDTNIFIINLYNAKKEKNDYLAPEEIRDIIKEVNPELVILNGFSKKALEADPLDISRKMKLGLNTKTQIIPAKELMTINPDAYNVVLKQKKLKGFLGE